jgi:hypothetical protein
MTAEPPQSPVTEGVRSLEVRWIFPGQIFPGQLGAAVAGWFGRFPAETESRQDTYLLDPPLRGLSVKIRGGRALEVKAYRGSPGILQVAGRARGRLESWQKWSFPLSPLSQNSGDPPGWRPVRKRRRISRFPLASGQIVAPTPGPAQQPRYEVELTEVHANGQDWWTADRRVGLQHMAVQVRRDDAGRHGVSALRTDPRRAVCLRPDGGQRSAAVTSSRHRVPRQRSRFGRTPAGRPGSARRPRHSRAGRSARARPRCWAGTGTGRPRRTTG